jgi:hypothetical protein
MQWSGTRVPDARSGPALDIVGKYAKSRCIQRADCAEVPLIECDHYVSVETFSQRDDRGVGTTEGKVTILSDKFSDAPPIRTTGSFNFELRQSLQESSLCLSTKTNCNEISHLGHNEGGNDKLEFGTAECFERS